jgi:hypothetical protein
VWEALVKKIEGTRRQGGTNPNKEVFLDNYASQPPWGHTRPRHPCIFLGIFVGGAGGKQWGLSPHTWN